MDIHTYLFVCIYLYTYLYIYYTRISVKLSWCHPEAYRVPSSCRPSYLASTKFNRRTWTNNSRIFKLVSLEKRKRSQVTFLEWDNKKAQDRKSMQILLCCNDCLVAPHEARNLQWFFSRLFCRKSPVWSRPIVDSLGSMLYIKFDSFFLEPRLVDAHQCSSRLYSFWRPWTLDDSKLAHPLRNDSERQESRQYCPAMVSSELPLYQGQIFCCFTLPFQVYP